MSLLFPNAVIADASLGCDLSRCNSSTCFLRERRCRSCPLAGLWGGHELGSPTMCQCGAGWRRDGNGWEVREDVHGVSQVRPGWRLSLSCFPLLRKDMGALGVL